MCIINEDDTAVGKGGSTMRALWPTRLRRRTIIFRVSSQLLLMNFVSRRKRRLFRVQIFLKQIIFVVGTTYYVDENHRCETLCTIVKSIANNEIISSERMYIVAQRKHGGKCQTSQWVLCHAPGDIAPNQRIAEHGVLLSKLRFNVFFVLSSAEYIIGLSAHLSLNIGLRLQSLGRGINEIPIFGIDPFAPRLHPNSMFS